MALGNNAGTQMVDKIQGTQSPMSIVASQVTQVCRWGQVYDASSQGTRNWKSYIKTFTFKNFKNCQTNII